jgi:hypothetical protein
MAKEHSSKLFPFLAGLAASLFVASPFAFNVYSNHNYFNETDEGRVEVRRVNGFFSYSALEIGDLGGIKLTRTHDPETGNRWTLYDFGNNKTIDHIFLYGEDKNFSEYIRSDKTTNPEIFDRADIFYQAELDRFMPIFEENGYVLQLNKF